MTISRREIGALVHLPNDLHFVIAPALKYGKYQFADQVAAFVDTMGASDLAELRRVSEELHRVDTTDRIELFMDKYPMTEYPEVANLYFFCLLMDEVVGSKGTPELTEQERIVDCIAILGRHGSYRLASHRMFAAKELAGIGVNAQDAVPTLRQAITDSDVRVRLWAHCALACIDGESIQHRVAITHISQELPQDHGDWELIQLMRVEALSMIDGQGLGSEAQPDED